MYFLRIINTIKFHERMFSLKLKGSVAFNVRFENGYNIALGRNIMIKEYSKLSASGGRLIIGDDCYIDRNVVISCHGGSIEIGNFCSFNPNCVIYGHGGLKIGDYVRIATGTIIIPANHTFIKRRIPICKQPISKKGICIGDDVWIGANCVVLDGVEIGRGSIIGAGSIISKSIPEYSVAVGNPAKVIKKR